jgi:hypothetical protein
MEKLLKAVLPAACILALLTAMLLPWDRDEHAGHLIPNRVR